MAETSILSKDDSFTYKGLVNIKDFYMVLDKWLADRGYDKQEMFNSEEIYETGKQLFLDIKPYKEVSDYAKVEIEIMLDFRKCKEVTVERKGRKATLMNGEFTVTFNTFLVTDLADYWDGKPIYYFLRTIAEKFLYKGYIEKAEEIALKDTGDLKRELKAFLNMHRYS